MTGAVVAAFALAGCSSGATINPKTLGPHDKLCVDTLAFQSQAAALEQASTSGTLSDLQTVSAATRDALKGLVTDAATLPDKVNGHLVRDDLATAAATYTALAQQLQAASPSDPNAVSTALSAVQSKEGQAFTDATGRLDAYTSKVCGLSPNGPPTTAPASATSTSVAPIGPTGATTTGAPSASTTTTAAPSSSTSAAAPPASTTSTSTP
jgi:hypothetical protein